MGTLAGFLRGLLGMSPRSPAPRKDSRAAARPGAVITPSAQLRAKLEALRAEGVERYDVETAGDDHVCEACARIAAGGPYRVAAPVLPGWPHCKACRCTILPVD